MSRRRVIVRQRTRWTVAEWVQRWDLAMARIDGVPALLEKQAIFQDCLTVLNGAFADGDRLRFELAVNVLVDFCAEAVNQGDCEQWWK